MPRVLHWTEMIRFNAFSLPFSLHKLEISRFDFFDLNMQRCQVISTFNKTDTVANDGFTDRQKV
jgi:hypothetical protein